MPSYKVKILDANGNVIEQHDFVVFVGKSEALRRKLESELRWKGYDVSKLRIVIEPAIKVVSKKKLKRIIIENDYEALIKCDIDYLIEKYWPLAQQHYPSRQVFKMILVKLAKELKDNLKYQIETSRMIMERLMC